MSPHLHISPETRFLRLAGSLPLASGERLGGLEVAYRTWGALAPARDNAVVVCHALTGSADVDRWWSGLFGPGRALDPERDFVVAANLLGSCYGTTGPLSLRPATDGAARRWGASFPAITVRDQARLYNRLLDALEIERVTLVLGGSLGGMVALEMVALAADGPREVGRFERLALFSAPVRHGPWGIALSELGRRAIELDPKFRSGDYPPDDPPAEGLALARALAMTSYRSRPGFEQRFGRRVRDGRFEVARYLEHQGRKLVSRFDANSYLTLLRAMDGHDLARGEESAASVARRLTLPALVVASSTDVLYPPEDQLELATYLPQAEYVEIGSAHGHDAFLVEQEAVERIVRDFRQRTARGESETPRFAAAGGGMSWRVLKFGGTSVGSAAALAAACDIVRRAAEEGPTLVVASALAGVTTEIARRLDQARAGDPGWREGWRALEVRHRRQLSEAARGRAAAGAADAVDRELARLFALLHGMELLGEAPPRTRARALASGERMSTPIFVAALETIGVAAEAVDGTEALVARGSHTDAFPDVAASRSQLARRLASIGGAVPVVAGFFGADSKGAVRLFGRGGSDTSATAIGAALPATRIEIWTDVDGVATADPRRDPSARLLPRLSYAKAEEMARAGARVLHWKAVAPARLAGVPIVVRNTFATNAAGTWIGDPAAMEAEGAQAWVG